MNCDRVFNIWKFGVIQKGLEIKFDGNWKTLVLSKLTL